MTESLCPKCIANKTALDNEPVYGNTSCFFEGNNGLTFLPELMQAFTQECPNAVSTGITKVINHLRNDVNIGPAIESAVISSQEQGSELEKVLEAAQRLGHLIDPSSAFLVDTLYILSSMHECKVAAEGNLETYMKELHKLLPEGVTVQNEFGFFSYQASKSIMANWKQPQL